MGIWGVLRTRHWVKSAVRGINAGAAVSVYTAVYQMWQVGYMDGGFQSGRSLVVVSTSYVGGRALLLRRSTSYSSRGRIRVDQRGGFWLAKQRTRVLRFVDYAATFVLHH